MKKLRFLVSLLTRENDYQLEQAGAARKAAGQAGVDLEILFADNDAITQSTQLLRAVQGDPASRPSAIVCEPVGGTCLPQVARAAVKNGIAWAILNREADYTAELRGTYGVAVCAITVDNKEIGRIQGRQFAALLPRGGSVLYIQGPSENAVAKDRFAGMQITLPSNLQVTTLRGQWTQESAHRCVGSWLRLNTSTRTPIDLVGAQNDAMAMGARKTLEEAPEVPDKERWMTLPFTGCDGVPETGQAWVRKGLLAATVVVPATAGHALTLLTQALQSGSKPPERSFTTPESFPALEQLSAK